MTKKIKVCWITNAPSPYKVDLINLLSEDVEVIALFEDRIDKENVREQTWYGKEFGFQVKYLCEENKFQLLKQLAKECDCLINGDYSKPICMLATEIFRFYKKPSIMQVDGGIAQDRGWLVNSMMSLIMQRNTAFLSSGSETDKYLHYYGVDDKKIFHYHFSSYFASDIENNEILKNNRDALKDELGFRNQIVVFSVGQQIARKGYDVLAKACVGLPDNVKIVIAGGKANEETATIIKDNNLKNISFIGFKQKEELYKYFAMSDIFVLPTRYDIWGLVINEAMSFGLPIISTNKCVAAMEFYQQKSNGIIVEAGNHLQLHEALMNLIEKKDQRIEYGNNSLTLIKEYTLEKMAEDYINAFNKIVKER